MGSTGRVTKVYSPLPDNFRASEIGNAVAPPEREIAKRKKTPIKEWSVKLRLKCKDKPKSNKPKGAGAGSKKFVPWC